METGLRERKRERVRRKGEEKREEGWRESYHSIRPIYFPAHNSTNPSDARFPLVLGSFQPASLLLYALVVHGLYTYIVAHRAPRKSEIPLYHRAFVYSKLELHFFVTKYPCNILAFFLIDWSIKNQKKVKLKVIGGLKVLSIFFFFKRRIRKIRKRKEYLLKNLFRETSGRMRL